MRSSIAVILFAALAAAQQQPPELPKLKSRTETTGANSNSSSPKDTWIVPAGTRIPIQLRQPISTKDAQPGDPVYAQTTFPIVIDGDLVIPAGTWVQGAVDSVKRAGRIKGTAALQFHLTTLIYANGYTLDIAAAIARVPGDTASHMQEPGTVQHDSEKGKDLKRIGEDAATGAEIGAIAGTASRSITGVGIGGLSGIAAGTLIALLARGSDVRFETGTAVEIALNHAMAIEPEKAARPALLR